MVLADLVHETNHFALSRNSNNVNLTVYFVNAGSRVTLVAQD